MEIKNYLKNLLNCKTLFILCVTVCLCASLQAQRSASELLTDAKRGNKMAQYNLAILYANGNGVIKDPAQAVYWYQKAAEQGVVNAQFDLANCYINGEGIYRNHGEAVKWYSKAAEQGHVKSQYILANCYEKGEGIQKDLARAVLWYRKAANQEHSWAQYCLAICYDFGNGIAKDENTALYWYEQAIKIKKNEYNLDLAGKGFAEDRIKLFKSQGFSSSRAIK